MLARCRSYDDHMKRRCYDGNMTHRYYDDNMEERGYGDHMPRKRYGDKRFLCLNDIERLQWQDCHDDDKEKLCVSKSNKIDSFVFLVVLKKL